MSTLFTTVVTSSVVTSLIVALAVAYFAPKFQHGVWKKQKLREQRLETAKQFQACASDLAFIWDLDSDDAARQRRNKLLTDLNSICSTVRILFDRKETRSFCDMFQRCLAAPPDSPPPLDFTTAYSARSEIVARLFAESLDRPVPNDWWEAGHS
jgi:hypothetical protein